SRAPATHPAPAPPPPVSRDMTPIWQAFLATQTFAAGPDSEPSIVALPDFATVRVDGADARTFLQGQFTNDVHDLSPGEWHWSGYLSPKGRLLAVFRLACGDESWTLSLPATVATDLVARLRRFVLRSKVRIGLPEDEATLGIIGIPLGGAPGECVLGDGYLALGLDGDRALVHGDPAALVAIWQNAVAHGARPTGPARWHRMDLEAGAPWIVPANQDQFVPQMVDLDRLGGVSFAKGCYPGQEIVARTHYRGEIKRRLHRASAAADVAPGTVIRAGDAAIGHAVASAPAADGGFLVIAALDRDAAAAATALHAGDVGPVALANVRPFDVAAA
ncbi:MAG: folate-binding protein YgfZ, partial [Burkholderiales bacterium]|nr:folate-binding protein YgfZ [Burkholderiales bacterium]